MDQLLTYILSAVGILGFFLAGKKVWWAWYVNIANQALWLFFSFITQQWGFLLATGFYFVVFSINAYKWTKEYLDKRRQSPNGMVLSTNPKPPEKGPEGPAGTSEKSLDGEDKVQILAAIYQIDNATSLTTRHANHTGIPSDVTRMVDALEFAKKTLQSILKGR